MAGKRDKEGYLLIDHRNSPGIPPEMALAAGYPVGAGVGLFEAPTYTCSHCQAVVVLNPKRNRDRAYCQKCDHYICDDCGAAMGQTKECHPFEKLADTVLEMGVRQTEGSNILLLTGSK